MWVVNAVSPTTVRLAPSLLVTRDEIDEAVTILAGVLADVAAASDDRASHQTEEKPS